MRIHSTAKLAPVTTLAERRADALEALTGNADIFGALLDNGPNPRRNDADYWADPDDTEAVSMTSVERAVLREHQRPRSGPVEDEDAEAPANRYAYHEGPC